MKTLLLALFLSLISTFGFAQNQQAIDSLLHELFMAKHDTAQVLIMTDLCDYYRNTNPDSAQFYGNKALTLAQKLKFLKGESRAFHRLGSTYRIIGDLPKALSLIYNSLQIAEENRFYRESARCFNLLGVLFRDLDDISKAIYYLQQAFKTNQLLPNSTEKIRTDLQILSNISNMYADKNRLDSASYYLRKVENLIQKGNIKTVPSGIMNSMGQIEFLFGNYQKALAYSHQAIRLSQNDNDHRMAGTIYSTLATYLKDLNQPDSAIYYSKIGLAESQSIDYQSGILSNSSLLAKLYESKDIRKTYEYQKIAVAANEEIYGAKKVQALQKTIVDELLRQRALKAKEEAYQTQLRQYAFIAGLGVLLLIAFLLYRANNQQKRANQLLYRQKEEINHQRNKAEKALSELKSTQAQLIQSEKLASLGELTAGIAHEIQNPLNFVNNFSELSVDLADELEDEINKPELDRDLISDLTKDLKSNQEKINHHGKRASSIVKGMLEHSRTSTGVKELTDINKLADEYLRLSYHGIRAKDHNFNSDFKTDFDENLPKIEVIPQDIGRVLLNLINNAFWAVKTIEKPEVVVKTEHSDNQITIKVTDNGIGMSEATKAKIFQPFFTTKPTGEGTGLGLSLAYDIVTKGHGGTLEVESSEGVGTTFIITL